MPPIAHGTACPQPEPRDPPGEAPVLPDPWPAESADGEDEADERWPEPPASDVDDRPWPELPETDEAPEGAWPAQPEPREPEPPDWDEPAEDPEPSFGPEGEHVIVGAWEPVELLQPGPVRVEAHCDTGAAASALYGALERGAAGAVLRLQDVATPLPCQPDGAPGRIRVALRIAGQCLEAELELCAPPGPATLRLGRDLLAGRALVDPARDPAPR